VESRTALKCSTPTVSARSESTGTTLAFLQNHRELIAAFDLLTVPTVAFRVLYCFLRRVLRDYVNYCEQDRLHDSLDKEAPNRRALEQGREQMRL